MSDNLPLPEPHFSSAVRSVPPLPPQPFYTAGQLRAYAAAAVAAERERCAKVCEDIEDSAYALWRTLADPVEQGRSIGAQHCADAIRA